MVFCTQSGAGLMVVSGFSGLCFCVELLGFPVFLQWKEKPLPVYIVHCPDNVHWKRIFRDLAFGSMYVLQQIYCLRNNAPS